MHGSTVNKLSIYCILFISVLVGSVVVTHWDKQLGPPALGTSICLVIISIITILSKDDDEEDEMEIGKEQKEVTFEPIDVPVEEPVTEPVPEKEKEPANV